MSEAVLVLGVGPSRQRRIDRALAGLVGVLVHTLCDAPDSCAHHARLVAANDGGSGAAGGWERRAPLAMAAVMTGVRHAVRTLPIFLFARRSQPAPPPPPLEFKCGRMIHTPKTGGKLQVVADNRKGKLVLTEVCPRESLRLPLLFAPSPGLARSKRMAWCACSGKIA